MPDVLIRDLSADDLARLDARAAALGISRSEFLRRQLHAEAMRPSTVTQPADFERFAERFSDLADADVMRGAWS